jgi:hypothetical protein
MHEHTEHLVAEGECAHQRPGITHDLFDYSAETEYLEIATLADFKTMDVEGPCVMPVPGRRADVRDEGGSGTARWPPPGSERAG